MIDLGHEVEIFGDVSNETNICHPEIHNYSLLQKSSFFPKMPNNWLIRFIKALYLAVFLFPKNPRAVLKSLDIKKYGRIASSMRLIYALKPFIQEPRVYDIVHCHFGGNGMRAIFLRDVGLISGKLVTVFHGADVTAAVKNHGPKVYDQLLKKGDLFLPISDKWRHEIINLGAPSKNTIVHRMGVDSLDISAKKSTKNDVDQIRLISICRLTEKKGIEFSLKALALLNVENVDIHYDIIGDGPLKSELVLLSKELGIGDKVKFHGAINKLEVQKFLSHADISIQPSVTASDGDQEGIPVSIMEAMAFSLPVISTLHSGIPELIADGDTGILVREREITELSDAMSKLILQPELRTLMGQKAQLFILNNYNIETLNQQLESHFSRLIQDKST